MRVMLYRIARAELRKCWGGGEQDKLSMRGFVSIVFILYVP